MDANPGSREERTIGLVPRATGRHDGPSIRPALPADNPALLDLARGCPMQGDISLAIERDPDFFALARARGRSRTYVAEVGGRIVACGSVCRRPAYVRGVPTEIGYIADLRVLPGFRRAGLARALVEAIAAGERDEPPAAYIGSAAAGNRAVAALRAGLGATFPLVSLGTFTTFELFPRGRRRSAPADGPGRADAAPAPADGSLRATARDEEELARFLDDYHRARTLAPVFAGGGLRDLRARSPGMALADYRIARAGGRIVAALGVWDASLVKHTRVLGLPRHLVWAGRIAPRLGRVLPLPTLPVVGEQLRPVYIRHAAYAPGALPALAGLVRALVRELAGSAYQFALFTCAAGDPIAGCVRGNLRTQYHYGLFAGAHHASWAPRLAELQRAPLYDDAALS